mgnify:CR=1 FL=1
MVLDRVGGGGVRLVFVGLDDEADLLIAGGGLALILLVVAVILAWRAQGARRGDTVEAMRRRLASLGENA